MVTASDTVMKNKKLAVDVALERILNFAERVRKLNERIAPVNDKQAAMDDIWAAYATASMNDGYYNPSPSDAMDYVATDIIPEIKSNGCSETKPTHNED